MPGAAGRRADAHSRDYLDLMRPSNTMVLTMARTVLELRLKL